MFIPYFQITPLFNQLLVDCGESGTGLMFTCESVAVITSNRRWGRYGEKKE
jgi:hypothetical protein